jgi:hypothetical protein
MNLKEVNVTTIETETGQEISDNFYRVCAFCDKIVRVQAHNFKSCENLGGNKFYCPFCLRNGHNFRSNRQILGLSFRGIFGFYYYRLYDASPKKMYFCQLESIIDKHRNIGLQNPALNYDPSIFMWYADFNKIGNHARKAPYSEVKQSIKLMIESFNLNLNTGVKIEDNMLSRFTKAMDLFYEKRQRPNGRRMLIPTLNGFVHSKNNEEFFESTRNFVKSSMILL